MAAPNIGDTTTFGTQDYRFQQGPSGINAWRAWTPWGKIYTAITLAAAKLLPPVDDTVDEKAIILHDTGSDDIYFYIQKAVGYGVDFDASFNLIWASNVTYINSSTIAAVLATINISSLSGMTSTSSQVEASIVDEDANSVVLSGISAGNLSSAVSSKHTQHTDTGTTQATFEINSGGNKATLDTSSQSGNITIDLDQVNDNLDLADAGMPILSKTKTQAFALGASSGQTVFISDIDTDGYILTWNGTDWVSGLYFMQDTSNTIATSPSVGVAYNYLNLFWECIDATANKEVFKVSNIKPVTAFTANDVLTAGQCIGGQIISNDGAGGAVILTSPTEFEGMHIILLKAANQNFTFKDSAAVTIIANIASETDVQFELHYAEGAWIPGPNTGTWS